MNDAMKQGLVVVMLIGAGLLSPSNGVDDKVDRDPLQMLQETSIIVLVACSVLVIFRLIALAKYHAQELRIR